MKNLLVVIGPRRSGLHAVCNWLIGHFPGRVRFVNDPTIALPPALRNFSNCFEYGVDPDEIRLLPTLHLLQERAQRLNEVVAHKLPWPWRNIALRVQRNFWNSRIMSSACPLPELDDAGDTPPDTHIILFENLTPAAAAQVLPAWLAAYRAQFDLPPVEQETIVIVLRSPWNTLASTLNQGCWAEGSGMTPRGLWNRLKRIGAPSGRKDYRLVPPEKIGETWIAFAKEVSSESRYLEQPQWQVQPLLYDAWITTPELRASIASRLGRPLNDRGLARTAFYGGGSSFDGNQRAASSPQDLTNRWRHFQDHPTMQALLASPDIRRLAAALRMILPTAG